MKAIQGFLAVVFSCVLLGGVYIGSVILGYFLATVGVVLSILTIVGGILCFVAYCLYELFQHITGNTK
jgi:hypothetical protein